ncbi:hypothetical protein ACFL6P_03410 [Candidatus Latescibacterota bacterium]
MLRKKILPNIYFAIFLLLISVWTFQGTSFLRSEKTALSSFFLNNFQINKASNEVFTSGIHHTNTDNPLSHSFKYFPLIDYYSIHSDCDASSSYVSNIVKLFENSNKPFYEWENYTNKPILMEDENFDNNNIKLHSNTYSHNLNTNLISKKQNTKMPWPLLNSGKFHDQYNLLLKKEMSGEEKRKNPLADNTETELYINKINNNMTAISLFSQNKLGIDAKTTGLGIFNNHASNSIRYDTSAIIPRSAYEAVKISQKQAGEKKHDIEQNGGLIWLNIYLSIIY